MLIKRGEATAINTKLSQVRNERIQENREKLIPIIDCSVLWKEEHRVSWAQR